MSALDGVKKLQNIIGYEFKNTGLVTIALTHPGFKKRDRISNRNFERLEFLGDRVLGLALSNYLYEKFPQDSEGDLAMRIAILAGTDFLINLAKKTKILDSFSIPSDFFISVNKNSSSIADMFEAVLGALFLDSNFETTKDIIAKLWENDINASVPKEKDSKSRLQEITQAESCELPIYRLLKTTGEAHDPVFEMEARACGESAVGCGFSKRNAEHDAAAKLIEKLGNRN
jgi:ribonuclease-3